MLVLAAVPTIQFHKLRRAAAPRFPVVHARSWDDALATIRALGRAGRRRPAARRRPQAARDRAVTRAVPVPALAPLHGPLSRHRGGPPRPRPLGDQRRRVHPARRPPRAAARSPGARRGTLRLAPAPRSADRRAGAAADRAALGRGRSAERPGRAPDRATGGGARPRGPPHLRALVRTPRPALAAPFPRGGPRALRPPAAAGPGLHDRRRRPAPRLRPDQDAPAPRPRLSRPHRRRDAAHARAPPGARAHRPGLRSAAPDAGFGMTTGAPHPPSPPSPPPRPSTILVVEDDGALRRVLERVLARQGYRVLAAASAETAYELLASEPADAVLLDVQLPTMSGLALYLALIHRHPNLAGRIAIMSGDPEADHVRTWLQHNPCTVLKKPFDLREIVEWAHELLDVSDRQTENGA